MESRSIKQTLHARALAACSLLALGCAFVLLGALGAGSAGAQSAAAPSALSTQQITPTSPSGAAASATIEECVTAAVQEQRAVAFSAEMTAVPGTARMAMRIDLEERTPDDVEFHTVSSPGLGVWRSSDAKVKVYKYLRQVTNLSAPASYRGFVRFRWLNAKGHVMKRAERVTSRCLQPGQTEEGEPSAPAGSSSGSSSGSVKSKA
ncbi:MAG TPA: hypothetical protein VK774_10280 [Solirubrobacteraceae bacterium]|jgi:hypothetical protein|nr:hypothetical protein [Solirubrobacteraceae bacterium]